MRLCYLKPGNGKLTTTVVFFAFVLSLSTVVVYPFVDAVCHWALISYILMRMLQLGVFLFVLAVALFPNPIPMKKVWIAHDIPSWQGSHIHTLVRLLGWVIAMECFVQIISAVLGNAINAEKLKAEVIEATDSFSTSNTASTLLFGENGFLAHVIVAPFVEELVFRGIFLNFFLSRYKIGVAICATSVIFGAMHGNYLSAFFGGMFLGYVYVAWGRLWLCILLHGFANLLTMVFFGLGGGFAILNFVQDSTAQFFVFIILASIAVPAVVKVRYLFNQNFTSAFSDVSSPART
jgi:membrane protease YdiL (CAAX protease family)